MHLYIGVKPMQTKMMNWLHFLEETIISACCLHMLCFMWADDFDVQMGYGWSMIVIMNLHFLAVCLWMAYLFKELMRVVCKKYTAVWRVYAVRKYGFRIGGNMKNRFAVDTGSRRHVKQMMRLSVNQ